MALYNLADTCDEIGDYREAANYWRAYLRVDPLGERGEHARQRLGACAGYN
jgi:hypothetical protein